MKATGIVRRIDDLGRVVVPKEIRRTLRIHEGDPLEIFTDSNGSIVLKKYSPIGELSEYARYFSQAIGNVIGRTVLICDRDYIISASGERRKDYAEKRISQELENIIANRSAVIRRTPSDGKCTPICDGENTDRIFAQVIRPIISEGQPIGAVIVLANNSGDQFTDVETKSAEVAAVYLGSQMEQ
ncbi:MAG: stage V sporulation protein T [Christensenellaceae bacterium]|nr:stage V sporulation protein T [Christensenellaceae bacterium]